MASPEGVRKARNHLQKGPRRGTTHADSIAAGLLRRERAQSLAESSTGADAELGEDLAHVPLHRARADVELRRDLRVRPPLGSEPGDVLLLRGQLDDGVDAASASGLA